jgi:hypothetical protein
VDFTVTTNASSYSMTLTDQEVGGDIVGSIETTSEQGSKTVDLELYTDGTPGSTRTIYIFYEGVSPYILLGTFQQSYAYPYLLREVPTSPYVPSNKDAMLAAVTCPPGYSLLTKFPLTFHVNEIENWTPSLLPPTLTPFAVTVPDFCDDYQLHYRLWDGWVNSFNPVEVTTSGDTGSLDWNTFNPYTLPVYLMCKRDDYEPVWL